MSAKICIGGHPDPQATCRPSARGTASLRSHHLRLIAIGDAHDSARDGDAPDAREYHPYGLMVWDGFA